MTHLSVNNLAIQFHGTDAPTVSNISFTVNERQIVAIVGESGSGKSITAQALMQLNPATYCPTGSIMFNGDDILTTSADTLRRLRGNDISMVFQEPMSALNPLHTIDRQLRESITIHAPTLDSEAIEARINELLDNVELSYLKARRHHYPHQLSGGERQRIMIAMAIANRPALLIADEPTTALDVTTQAKIIALLQGLRSSHNMAILLITHDLHLVRDVADHTIVMQAGAIVEQNDTDSIFNAPSHPYTQSLIAARHAQPPMHATTKGDVICETTDLSISYRTAQGFSFRKAPVKVAVKPLSISIRTGETLGIVGESGSGKTSLGLAIARLIPSTGTIVFQGNNIQNKSLKQLRAIRPSLQFVFQDPFASLNPRMTVAQLIAEGLILHHNTLNTDERLAKVHDILQKVGLTSDIANRYPHEFSGGQRQRINIARAMILSPSCVIFDEPTSALDVTLQTQIIALLKLFQQERGCAYIFISHDMHAIRSMSHYIMVLKHGEVMEYGDAQRIFTSPDHDYTRTLINAASLTN